MQGKPRVDSPGWTFSARNLFGIIRHVSLSTSLFALGIAPVSEEGAMVVITNPTLPLEAVETLPG